MKKEKKKKEKEIETTRKWWKKKMKGNMVWKETLFLETKTIYTHIFCYIALQQKWKKNPVHNTQNLLGFFHYAANAMNEW